MGPLRQVEALTVTESEEATDEEAAANTAGATTVEQATVDAIVQKLLPCSMLGEFRKW